MATTWVKLTQRAIDAALRGDRTAAQTLRDNAFPGFIVEVHRRGVSFSAEVRPRGRDPVTGKRYPNQYPRIGDHHTHSLAEALNAWRALRLRVQQGQNPKADATAAAAQQAAEAIRREAAEHAATAARIASSTRLEAYTVVLTTRGLSRRHVINEAYQVSHALAAIGAETLTPAEITRSMIETMLALCPPLSRSARFAALHRFLSWALKGTDRVSPGLLFDHHERPRRPPPRRRVLSGPELAALWRAAERLPGTLACDLVRFLIAVPCRRGEAELARWNSVDTAARAWHLPTTKNGRPHDFPLSDRALAILERRRAATGGHPDAYVFLAAATRTCYRDVIPELARHIDPATPVSDFRLHDCRRSFVTLLADTGNFDETLLDLTIGHVGARSGVRGVYQHSQRWPERVAALNAWDRMLGVWLGENVAQLRRAAS